MEKEKIVANTGLVPPTEEISKVEETSLTKIIMDMVEPRFQNYNRPLLLSMLVAILTFGVMITTFCIVMSVEPKKIWIHPVPKIDEVRNTSESCTRETRYQQIFADVYTIRDFMRTTRDPYHETSEENVAITVSVGMCLANEAKILHYDKWQKIS